MSRIPVFPPELGDEARTYLDDLVRRRSGRLSITTQGEWWVAHVEWNDGHPVHPIIGYTQFGKSQAEAVYALMRTVQNDRENVR